MFEEIELKDGRVVEIDFDIETNLPKLPKGYFWRINPDSRWINVELRKKRRWGSDLIDYAITDTPEIEWVRVVAGRVWYDFHRKNKLKLEFQEFAKYYGDYPPKAAV